MRCCIDLIGLWRSTDKCVENFAKFLEGTWNTEQLHFYLFARKGESIDLTRMRSQVLRTIYTALQDCPFGHSYPSAHPDLPSHFLCTFRATFVARVLSRTFNFSVLRAARREKFYPAGTPRSTPRPNTPLSPLRPVSPSSARQSEVEWSLGSENPHIDSAVKRVKENGIWGPSIALALLTSVSDEDVGAAVAKASRPARGVTSPQNRDAQGGTSKEEQYVMRKAMANVDPGCVIHNGWQGVALVASLSNRSPAPLPIPQLPPSLKAYTLPIFSDNDRRLLAASASATGISTGADVISAALSKLLLMKSTCIDFDVAVTQPPAEGENDRMSRVYSMPSRDVAQDLAKHAGQPYSSSAVIRGQKLDGLEPTVASGTWRVEREAALEIFCEEYEAQRMLRWQRAWHAWRVGVI